MISTEQNKKNGGLGETRTFSIQAHSADTIKQNINTANEQSLERKNLASAQNQHRSAPAPNQVHHASVANAQNVRMQNPVNGEVRTRPQNGPRVQNHPVQNGNVPPRNAPVNDVRSQAARPVQNGQNARTVSNAAQNPAGNAHVQQNRGISVQQNQPPHRPVPQPKPEAARSGLPAAQNQRTGHVQEDRALQPRPERLPEKRPEQNPARLESSLVKKSAELKKADEIREKRAQMMKTKKTDIGALNDQNKKDEKEKIYSDEGGNTVVSIVKAVVYIIFVLVVSVSLALCIINVGNDVFAFVKSDEIVEIEIPEFATLDEVADVLFMNDIIKYPTVFKLYAVAKNSDTDFLAGTYPVNAMMSYEVLLDEFKEKPETGTVDITIPEGYTVDEIIDLFVDGYGMGTREGFIDVIQNGEFDYWFMKELEENGTREGRIYRLEGYLFPDTYQFYKASSEWTIVNKMLKRFTQIFTREYRNQCEVFGYTVDEMITLASMIEKEAGSPSEFFMVSSVFHNRLNAPWNFPKLESDATVVYVVSHENGERTAITAADLTLDTPYNTYLYDGLPPGPIANPSASAMLAALSPQTSNYYFFIANKGVTYYSETKAQHEAYIAQFREDEPVQQTAGDMPVQ